MARRRNKSDERDVAARRVSTLLARARVEAAGPDPALADRYGRLVRGLAEKYQVGFPPAAKVALCRRCGAFRVPGRNARTRVRAGRVVTTCLSCGGVRRRPLAAQVPA